MAAQLIGRIPRFAMKTVEDWLNDLIQVKNSPWYADLTDMFISIAQLQWQQCFQRIAYAHEY